jgi:hypothetical protein
MSEYAVMGDGRSQRWWLPLAAPIRQHFRCRAVVRPSLARNVAYCQV